MGWLTVGGMVVLSFWGSRVVCSCLVGVVGGGGRLGLVGVVAWDGHCYTAAVVMHGAPYPVARLFRRSRN